MSIDEVERSIPIGSRQLFSHSEVIQPEIERLRDSFERNGRFREFDGLIRANHRIYEALEAKIASDPSKLSNLAIKMNALSERIRNITQPHFKEQLSGMDFSNKLDIAKLAEAKHKEFNKQTGGTNENIGQILPILEEE